MGSDRPHQAALFDFGRRLFEPDSAAAILAERDLVLVPRLR